jgi:MFS superfamily sulfate permease-like transporter
MYQLTGPLFFASSEKVLTRLMREVTARTLVLDLTKAGPIDSAATDCLRQLAERQLRRGGELRLIGLDQRLLASITHEVFGAADSAAPINLKQFSSSGGK